jgi:hypothetical protein
VCVFIKPSVLDPDLGCRATLLAVSSMAKTSASKKAMKAKESDLERSARLSLRSLELRQQACFKRVVTILRADHTYCAEVERNMIVDGKAAEIQMPLPQPKRRAKPLMLKENGEEEQDAAAHKDLTGVDADDGEDGLSLTSPSLKNKATVSKIPPTVVEKALSKAEPISMSDANLSKMRKRGQRVVAKETLWELLENCTDMNPDTTLEPEQRTENGFIRLVKDLNIANCRPARDLPLPADWGQDGHYAMSIEDATTVKITKRMTKQWTSVTVPRGSCPYIELNYSMQRATLRVKKGNMKWAMSSIFYNVSGNDDDSDCSGAGGGDPSQKRDGQPESRTRKIGKCAPPATDLTPQPKRRRPHEPLALPMVHSLKADPQKPVVSVCVMTVAVAPKQDVLEICTPEMSQSLQPTNDMEASFVPVFPGGAPLLC